MERSGSPLGAFVFRLGRLGLARANTTAIEGWRRLLWRFWWLEKAKLSAPNAPPKPPMHWAPGNGLPLCGASSREPWTIELEFATCRECIHLGWPMMLQWWTGNR